MSLPMTKGEINRLGDRLIADKEPAEADLESLAMVLAAYQEVLDQVKGHLRDLGFAPSARVKTTKTMTDKLRRTHGMELSRVQDLAGARIVVRDRAVQDQAAEKITGFYAGQGCSCRVVDRREDPRFGYKAIHLIPRIDGTPVEIQIRTELQDTWAQIVERLADRWGRGIRYGEEPENPDGIVRSGEFVSSRREAMTILMRLSDVISSVEERRQEVDAMARMLAEADAMFGEGLPKADPERLANKIPPEMVPIQVRMADVLAKREEKLDAEGRGILAAGADVTGAQLVRMCQIVFDLLRREDRERLAQLHDAEQRLRDILQLIAGATDEGA